MTMGTTLDAADWQRRAVAWELLGFSLRYPDEELVSALADGQWVQAACEVADALGLDLPDGWAEGVGACGIHELRAEATRLFIGGGKAPCTPYEGLWRAGEEGVEGLLFVNPHSVEVMRFCRSCGLGKPRGTNEPLDHIATECELMEYLSLVEAGMMPVPEGIEFPGGSAAAAYGEFFTEHLGVWAPRFAVSLSEQARLPYYRAAGSLLGAMLECGN